MMDDTNAVTMQQFTLEYLKQITDDFSDKNIIGRGGYGVVYKGLLDNGKEIALKKLHYVPGLDDTQFTNEVNNLMRVQHPNITQLVGYCYDIGIEHVEHNDKYVFAQSEQRIICFEYLQGGGLDKHISDESCGLDWPTHFKIIKGVCAGLNYLHNACKPPIYHLDLKPDNILMDKNMVPKIGDFGLSKLFPSAQTYITVKAIGTRGYMPPEYVERNNITSKFDVFSLGVVIIWIIAGHGGYTKWEQMSSQEFIEHVLENWQERLHGKMSLDTEVQITTCIEKAFECVEVDREKRPTIEEIVNILNKVDTAQNSPTDQVTNNQHGMSEYRGRIMLSTHNQPVQFDIFSCPVSPSSTDDELNLTDGLSYNYNGRPIPPAALKTLLNSPRLIEECRATNVDVDAGRVSGLIFISERDNGLETLYIALRFSADYAIKVFALADIFGVANFHGTRMEDSGCIGGGFNVGYRAVDHSLIYVSTKEPVLERRSPWTVVYKTSLTTGKTARLTPKGMFDLSPAVSPSGKTVAVASFGSRSWNGETQDLKTDIYVMNVDTEGSLGLGRKLLINNGGWPSWGSDGVIFFHRGTDKTLPSGVVETAWGVYRYNISTKEIIQVTPEGLHAVTPAAISETKVVVATIRQKSQFSDVREEAHYRHIEIFDMNAQGLPPVQITQKIRPKGDHYNPFVLDGGGRIGYHRSRSDLLQQGNIKLLPQQGNHFAEIMQKLESPAWDIGLSRVTGVFPAVSKDGSKLAFVDNDFKAVWLADSYGMRIVYKITYSRKIFSAVWNQNPDKDTLYVCVGITSCSTNEPLEIYAVSNVSGLRPMAKVARLTDGEFNNAFPSSNPQGNKLVFRSNRNGGEKKYNNLYIMLDTYVGEFCGGKIMQLTNGPWTDTDCQWSPGRGDWIVFSSTRGKPWGGDELDNGLERNYYSVYLVHVHNPTVVIKVMNSGGQINHPVFSPDCRSIAVRADLAAVSVDPISLPWGTQPCGDIFVVNAEDAYDDDLEKKTLKKKKKRKEEKRFRRMTHSRYECGTPVWEKLARG